jgi:hypothetical protein
VTTRVLKTDGETEARFSQRISAFVEQQIEESIRDHGLEKKPRLSWRRPWKRC